MLRTYIYIYKRQKHPSFSFSRIITLAFSAVKLVIHHAVSNLLRKRQDGDFVLLGKAAGATGRSGCNILQ
jgi:hypothetical protein